MSKLDQLAFSIAPMTDKKSSENDYLRAYECYFEELRDLPLVILELGIARGDSLALWSNYFPNSRIIGVDCREPERELGENILCCIGNLLDDKFMESVISTGPFDIIIDDASHQQPQTSHSLHQLWPHLNEGGLYIIEDLHTSYLPAFGMGYRQLGSVVEDLKGLIDTLHVDTYKKTAKSDVFELLGANCKQEKLNQFEESLESIHFYKGICFLSKE